MLLEFKIAWRFLAAKKRAMLMSTAGIGTGVALFIMTQAQTTGFEQFYIRTILGTSGAIHVRDRFQDTLRSMEAGGGETPFRIAHREARHYVEGVAEPDLMRRALLDFSNVSAVSEVVAGPAVIRTPTRSQSIQVHGIRLDDHVGTGDLARQIVFGDLANFRQNPQGVLIGTALARRMQLQVGDALRLSTPFESRPHRVAAIYETGVREIDQTIVYLDLTEARSLLRRPFGASFLQVNLWRPEEAARDAARIESALGHFAFSWQERERAWLEVFRALRVSSGLTVLSIIFLSGLGMFNTLAMIVIERTREIAILRAIGFNRRQTARIFLWQGGVVLTAGVLLGWMLGGLATWGVSKIPIRIRGIFSTDYFVVHWSVSHYLWAAFFAVLVVAAAVWFPARGAARLEPGEVIRSSPV